MTVSLSNTCALSATRTPLSAAPTTKTGHARHQMARFAQVLDPTHALTELPLSADALKYLMAAQESILLSPYLVTLLHLSPLPRMNNRENLISA